MHIHDSDEDIEAVMKDVFRVSWRKFSLHGSKRDT